MPVKNVFWGGGVNGARVRSVEFYVQAWLSRQFLFRIPAGLVLRFL